LSCCDVEIMAQATNQISGKKGQIKSIRRQGRNSSRIPKRRWKRSVMAPQTVVITASWHRHHQMKSPGSAE
jgi:hypothetical protein